MIDSFEEWLWFQHTKAYTILLLLGNRRFSEAATLSAVRVCAWQNPFLQTGGGHKTGVARIEGKGVKVNCYFNQIMRTIFVVASHIQCVCLCWWLVDSRLVSTISRRQFFFFCRMWPETYTSQRAIYVDFTFKSINKQTHNEYSGGSKS